LFAHQAAIAIHQSQQYDHLGTALVGGLKRLTSETGSPELARVLENAGEVELDADLLAIADQLNAVSQMGRAEQRFCLEILRAFSTYARSKKMIY